MRTALLGVGVPSANVRVLADAVPDTVGLPTRAAILLALEQMGQRARPGDWAVLYFSGHGSQQPQQVRPGDYVEPDGLDEIFLPYDVGSWDGSIGAVQGAIVDNEIGEAIAKLTSRQIYVWAIFDTCHAGDMAKGAASPVDGPVTRYVAPASLGVPTGPFTSAKGKQRNAAVHGAKVEVQSDRPAAGIRSNHASERLVTFYAAHADEPAAEEPLAVPAGFVESGGRSNRPRYFGLFTYLIADSLRSGSVVSFKRLAERVAERYKTRPYPTPLFEGPIEQTPEFLRRRP